MPSSPSSPSSSSSPSSLPPHPPPGASAPPPHLPPHPSSDSPSGPASGQEGKPAWRSWTTWKTIRSRRDPVVDVSIVTSGHDIADARLHRHAAALLAAGMRVEVLALGDVAAAPPGTKARTWPRVGGARRAALAARMASLAQGRVLFSLDPDSALACHASIVVSGRQLVVDVHEDYAAVLLDRPWAARGAGAAGKAAARVVEGFQKVAARAALTVVADDHLPPRQARRRLVVPNVPDPDMLPAPAPPDEEPRAIYVGDLRSSRGLFAMLAGVAAAPPWTLDLVGPVAPGDEERLGEAFAADPALAARVRLHGRRPPRSAWADAAGAWVGLLLLADTPAFREALPSKIHEYLACGLPVVTTDLPRQAELVRAAAAGVVLPGGDDEAVGAALGAQLRAWIADPAALHAMRSAAATPPAPPAGQATYADLAAALTDLL